HPHAPNNDEFTGSPRPDYDPPEASYKYGDEHDLNLYVEFMKNQITELLTNYGPVAGIWLDGKGVMKSPGAEKQLRVAEIYDHIWSLQPQTLVSFKQGVLGTEDFMAPERHYKREGDELLEICNTMQPYAWGYDRDNDVGHKTPDEVMEMLAHTKEMNANLLLNIGPLPDGTVFPDDVTSLREVGKRLKKQKELDVAYEHVGVAVQQKGTHVWGTSPVIGKDGRVHLFVAQWPMPENKKERFSGYFKTSEIAQYVGDSPEGPFEFVRMVVRDKDGTFNAPHNPTIQFIDDQYVLCFIVNSNDDRTSIRIIMYVADDLNGEWRPAKGAEPDGTILRRPDDPSIWCHNSVRGVANPSLLKHNGEYRIYFKSAIPDPDKEPDFFNREFGYGVATSKSLEGPYEFYPERLTSEEMELEDAYAFSYDGRVYLMSRDIGASLGDKEGGLLWVSEDGIHFPKEKTRRAFESLATYLDEGAMDGAAVHRGSEKGQLERPQVLLIDGEPAYLYVATGINTEQGFGSCSHVFKLKVKSK
ncbi:MAG: alpha-L-fucosidase, partial [Planctomycetes bacterium]|nr:alpha-L-fucosidase [Planctomycetota bacterium]